MDFGSRSLGRVNAFARLLVQVHGIDTSLTLLQPSLFPNLTQATRSKKVALCPARETQRDTRQSLRDRLIAFLLFYF